MVLERILLQTIKFDLQVEHPYTFLLRYVKQLKGNFGQMKWLGTCFFFFMFRHIMCTSFHDSGEKNKVCKVLQMAWTFVNDR